MAGNDIENVLILPMVIIVTKNELQWCSRNSSRILHEIFLLIGELAIRRTSFYDELIFPN